MTEREALPWRPLFRLDRRAVFSSCVLIAAVNLLLNRWVLGALAPGLGDRLGLGHLHLLSAVLVLALLVARRRVRGTVRVWHALVALPALALVGELGLRAALFSPFEVPLLEYPGLYADPYSDDLYWDLERLERSGPAPDPRFGWVERGGSLGVRGDRYREASDVRGRPVLFFGDSFVSGRLPLPLDELLPHSSVLDYGVEGYGTDQILLRLEAELGRPWGEPPLVLVGILPQDMDRALLTTRGAPKPYFRLVEGSLAGPFGPEPRDARWPGSFLLRAAASLPRLLLHPHRGEPRRRRALNRRLFERMVDALHSRDLMAWFVVFCERRELAVLREGRTPARYAELLEILRGLQAPVIEAHGFLDGAPGSLYLPDGHHTPLGSQQIAAGLAARLRAAR